jgi:hypothetical protein
MTRAVPHPQRSAARFGSHRRQGQTLLELTLALTIIAGTLVPALRLMRLALEQSRVIEQRNVMATFGVGKLEEHMSLTADNWSAGTFSGTLAQAGHPELRYSVTRSDSSVSGGIPDRLMAIRLTIWDDVNGNATRDATESFIEFASKAAKLAGY